MQVFNHVEIAPTISELDVTAITLSSVDLSHLYDVGKESLFQDQWSRAYQSVTNKAWSSQALWIWQPLVDKLS